MLYSAFIFHLETNKYQILNILIQITKYTHIYSQFLYNDGGRLIATNK